MMEGMLNDSSYNQHLQTYTAKKDLRVASYETVSKHVVEKYGTLKVSDTKLDPNSSVGSKFYKLNSANKDIMDMTLSEVFDTYGSKRIKYESDVSSDVEFNARHRGNKTDLKVAEAYNTRVYAGIAAASSLSAHIMKDTKMSSEIFNHFKKEGYDAIVDFEDAMVAEYPVILLNPKESIKKAN